MTTKKQLILLLAVIFSFSAFSVFAQVQNTDVVLSINPQYPAPNQSVTATVSSNSFDLNTTNITWLINGATSFNSIGKKDFLFTTGGIGSQMTIEVRISAPDGSLIDKAIIVNPAGVDLLWQGENSYTPPFYRGRSVVPSEGKFKVVAMPNLQLQGQKIPVENLSYNWKLDGSSQPEASGYGKNYLIFSNSYLDSENVVSVSASDVSNSATGANNITLHTSAPKIIFYEKDPVAGMKYENALVNFTMGTKPILIEAVPYFFSADTAVSSDLSYDWSIGGQQVVPSTKNILAIQAKQNGGNSNINLTINNVSKLFQTVTSYLGVSY